MATTPSTPGIAAQQAALLLQPLTDQLTSGQILELFSELGFIFPPQLATDGNFDQALQAGAEAAGKLPQFIGALDAAQGDDATLKATADLFKAVVQVAIALDDIATALNALSSQLPGDVAGFAGVLTERLLEYLVVVYLESNFPRLKAFLALLGVVSVKPAQVTPPTSTTQPPYMLRELHFDQLPILFKSPQDFMRAEYQWGEQGFDGELLLSRLSDLLFAYTVPAGFQPKTATTPATVEVLLFTLSTKSDISPPGLLAALNLGLQGSFTLDFPFFVDGWTIELVQQGQLDEGLTAVIAPPGNVSVKPPSGQLTGSTSVAVIAQDPAGPLNIFAMPAVGVLTAQSAKASIGVAYKFDASSGTATGEPVLQFAVQGAQFKVNGKTDSFLQALTPSDGVTSPSLDFGLGWSPSRGVFFTGGGLETQIPVHQSIGPFRLDFIRIRLAFAPDGKSLQLAAGVVGAGSIGPVTASFDALGVIGTLKLSRGNLGPADLDVEPLFPNGIGIDVDAGAVTGGGFLYFSDTRYSGAVELSVYGIAVKAFGLIDTVLPDGSSGYSFVIIISAEFTPIQLGFGFTLIGVGGLVGINRSIDSKALESGIQSGSIANVLFPNNPVADAPAIISDLARFFPGASSTYLFGPMAKLGWGTPTLLHGQLGIILVLPGPRLSILGIVNCALPTSSAALISLNMAIGGLLDFPGKLFWLEASLYDSHVVGFRISGGMAFRITWGDRPNFALAVGGFNPAYEPPVGFPSVKRCAVDFGINGNPSLTCQSYFAVTSNTAQAGASIDLRASGFGISLRGHLGFDALFIFSPFSFQVDFNASVSVTFLGVGLGLGLHGTISGPTPWRVQAQICVSVLFWDACLPIGITFGTKKRANLPKLDPWVGQSHQPDPSMDVLGLQDAIVDPNNWSGGFPSGVHPVVTLAESATATKPPIDPVGEATLHQKVLPLNYKLSKFGIYQPKNNAKFTFQSIQIGDGPSITNVTMRQDFFAPALYKDMKGDEKLSTPSYERHDAGFTVAPDNVAPGDVNPHQITYDTDVIDPVGNETAGDPFPLPLRHLLAMLAKGASALAGIRRSGAQRFVDPTAPVKVLLSDEGFVVADACSLVQSFAIVPAAVARSTAQTALDDHVDAQPSDAGVFRVVPDYLVRTAA